MKRAAIYVRISTTSRAMARAFSPAPLPDFKRHIIASAITAVFDRLNIAPICRPRLSDLEPRQLEILLGDLRRAIRQALPEARMSAPKTTRRRFTVRLRLTGEERRYVARLLAHLRSNSAFCKPIKWLLREPTSPEKG